MFPVGNFKLVLADGTIIEDAGYSVSMNPYDGYWPQGDVDSELAGAVSGAGRSDKSAQGDCYCVFDDDLSIGVVAFSFDVFSEAFRGNGYLDLYGDPARKDLHVPGVARVDGGLDLVGHGLSVFYSEDDYTSGAHPVLELRADGSIWVDQQEFGPGLLEELDPVFSRSVAGGITQADVDYWNSGVSLLPNMWLIGVGSPTSLDGENLDLYLNYSTGEIFQKVSDSWKALGNLTGPAGPAGPAGEKGADGAPGENGADGRDGSIWLLGEGVPYDADGVSGDLYLDVNTGDLYLKTQTGWGNPHSNLKGPAGDSLFTKAGPEVYYTNGKLGIGTSAPSSSLEVDGDITVTGSVVLRSPSGDIPSIAY